MWRAGGRTDSGVDRRIASKAFGEGATLAERTLNEWHLQAERVVLYRCRINRGPRRKKKECQVKEG